MQNRPIFSNAFFLFLVDRLFGSGSGVGIWAGSVKIQHRNYVPTGPMDSVLGVSGFFLQGFRGEEKIWIQS
jgi:hypothetical protein